MTNHQQLKIETRQLITDNLTTNNALRGPEPALGAYVWQRLRFEQIEDTNRFPDGHRSQGAPSFFAHFAKGVGEGLQFRKGGII